MAQIESVTDVLTRKGSIEHLWKIIDPENKYPYKTCLEEWYRLSLIEQRKLYLYLLYKKWRGETFYGTPLDIITNCKPYPTNWNGKHGVKALINERRACSAMYQGSYGIYTWDEAKVYEMTNVKLLN